MLTVIIVLVLVAAVSTVFLMKKGKIADTNNNNIPDAIETKVEAVKNLVEEVKEEVKKVKKPVAKKPAAPKPSMGTGGKKIIKKEK
jgi:cell division protein FtsL